MAKQTINLGTGPNTGTGEPIRTAFGKVNENFTEVYDIAQGAYDYANTIVSDTQIDPLARSTANAAYDEANSASELAQSAFDAANNVDVSANTGNTQFDGNDIYTETGRLNLYTTGAGEGETNRIDIEADNINIDAFENLNIEAVDSVNIQGTNGVTLQTSANDGSVRIETNANQEIKEWTFDADGNLTAPGNIEANEIDASNVIAESITLKANTQLSGDESKILSVANSSGDGQGYTTLRLIPDDTIESFDQYLIIDPTNPNHIHIRAGGTIDNSDAALILGGEVSHFAVYSGENPTVGITANNYSFAFGEFGYPTMSFPTVLFDDLPQAPGLLSGQRAFITDANLEAVGNFGEVVGGGGANSVPVWSDGTNWRIG
jgi:hypothetical protein